MNQTNSADTFGMRLTRMMAKRQMSNKTLADYCGYRSANEIVRIRQDAVSEKKLQDFLQRLAQPNKEKYQNELDDLQIGLQVNRMGQAGYQAREDLRHILLDEGKSENVPFQARLTSGTVHLADFLREQTEGAARVEVLCEGCFLAPFLTLFRPLLSNFGERMRFDHFIAVRRGVSPTRMLRSSFSILCESSYHLFLPAENDASVDASAITSNIAFLRVKRASSDRVWLLMLSDSNTCALSTVSLAAMQHYKNLLLESMPRFSEIKRTASRLDEGYQSFLTTCLSREKNRMTFQLKPDVSFEMIPPPILAKAIMGSPLFDTLSVGNSAYFTALYDLCMQRYNNLFLKRRMTQFICSAPDMAEFARTGHLMDHLSGMRNFNTNERKTIFGTLMTQMRSNPFFHLTFLKDQQPFPINNIIAYDGLGLLLLPNGAGYALDRDYNEVFLTNMELLRQVKEYLFRDLMDSQTYSQEEALAYMAQLIQMCR